MDLKSLFTWLDGRKSHLVAAAIGLAAALLWLFGQADAKELVFGELAAFGISALRHAIAKLPAEQQAQLQMAIDLYRLVSTKINELPAGSVVNVPSQLRIFPASPEPPSPSDPARPAETSPRL